MSRWVYELWADADLCLYVGQTTDLPRRMREHQTGQPFWSMVTRIEVTRCAAAEVDALEARRIRELRPANNRRFNPDFDGSAVA